MLETDIQAPPETPAEPESRNRTWLITGLVTVLALVVGGAIGWWLGSDDDSVEAPDFVERWEEAWLSDDPDAVAAMYAEDGVWEDASHFVDHTATSMADRDDVIEFVRYAQIRLDFDEVEVSAVIEGDDVLVFEGLWSGNRVERGETFSTPIVYVFEMNEDGLIDRSIVYYDNEELFGFPQLPS